MNDYGTVAWFNFNFWDITPLTISLYMQSSTRPHQLFFLSNPSTKIVERERESGQLGNKKEIRQQSQHGLEVCVYCEFVELVWVLTF